MDVKVGPKWRGSLKNWCFWTVVLEKTLERPVDWKEIKPFYSKENQPWIFIGRTDEEAEAPILWPCDVKSWLTGNDPDVGKDWGQDEKRETEEEMVWWHHWLYGYKFVQYLREVKDRKPGMLQPMGSQRVGHDWITKQLQHVKTDSLSGNALITVKIILFF